MNANQVRNMFNESGLSVSEWARLRGFSSGLVYQVLDGKRKCMRGQSHQIAVALGLKLGSSMNVEELNSKLEKISQEQKMVSL